MPQNRSLIYNPLFAGPVLRKRKRSPISILGIPLENANNDRWGVLIMDSSNEFECIDSEQKKFRDALRELNKVLNSCGVTA